MYMYMYMYIYMYMHVHLFFPQENVDVRVARIFNTYGPKMHMYDGKSTINCCRYMSMSLPRPSPSY